MFTDIVGYTAMVQENEQAALNKVGIHRSVIQSCTIEFDGEIVEFYGDGSLSIYQSALDAVQCAICMQKQYIDNDVPVRIGLHLGDVVFKDGTVYGDGVNVASRIEGMGAPGAVLLSDKLYLEIANHPEIQTKPFGTFTLKNVKEPVALHAVINEGLRIPEHRTRAVPSNSSLPQILISALVLAIVGFLIFQWVERMQSTEGLDSIKEQRIAVRFHDFAKVEGASELGAMASLWIGNRIREVPNTFVVRYEQAIQQPEFQIASAQPTELAAYAKRTGAVNLLEGAIFSLGDTVQFEAAIYHIATGDELHRFDPVRCHNSEPMTGINVLTENIRGWWATRDEKVLSVPRYDAFEAYLKARENWSSDYATAELLLNRSIELDSTFIDPYFLLLDLYYNKRRYKDRHDKIMEIRDRFPQLTPRQQNLLDYHSADDRGDLLETYRLYQSEIKVDPKDLFINTSAMALAHSYVHKESEVIDLFQLIEIDSLDFKQCAYCEDRLAFVCQAYMQLGMNEKVEEVLALYPKLDYSAAFYKSKYFIQQNAVDTVFAILAEANRDSIDQLDLLYMQLAREFAVAGRPDLSERVTQDYIQKWAGKKSRRGYIVECLTHSGKHREAFDTLKASFRLTSKHPWIVFQKGRLSAYLGDEEAAMNVHRYLDTLTMEALYDYGDNTYQRAVISAILNKPDESLDLLSNAWRQGHNFTSFNYYNDPDLQGLFDDPRFEQIVFPLGK